MELHRTKYNHLATCIIRNSSFDECISVKSLLLNYPQVELSIFNPSMEGDKL